MKYVADGNMKVTLSDGNLQRTNFSKLLRSKDMIDNLNDMTEKEAKKLVNKYFTERGIKKN